MSVLADPEAGLGGFKIEMTPPTPDTSFGRTPDMSFGTTPEDKVAVELPVDIEQLLDESEREALELLRTWSDATRARLRVRQPQPRDSHATAALKTLLDEQTQWLKATLDRTSSLAALKPASDARSTPARCCRLSFLGGSSIVGDCHPFTRRFKLAPLEHAYRQSLHRTWKRRVRLGGLFCFACLVQNAYLGMTEWRQSLDRWRPEMPAGETTGEPPFSETDLYLTTWLPVLITSLSYGLLYWDRVFTVARSQKLISIFLLCWACSFCMVSFVYSRRYEDFIHPTMTKPPEGLIKSDAALDSLWYAFGIVLLLVTLASICGLEPHVAACLIVVSASLIHARFYLTWRRRYMQDLPWSPVISVFPCLFATTVAYGQANMSRAAFLSNWLRVQDNETRLEQLARAKSHADHERMKVEMRLMAAAHGTDPSVVREDGGVAPQRQDDVLERAARDAPQTGDAYSELLAKGETYNELLAKGVRYASKEDHRSAAKACREAIALRPDEPRAYACLGITLSHSGHFAEAAQRFLEARERFPVGSGRWAVATAQAFNMLTHEECDKVAKPEWWNDEGLKALSARAVRAAPDAMAPNLMRATVLCGQSSMWEAGPRSAEELREAAAHYERAAALASAPAAKAELAGEADWCRRRAAAM